VNVARNIAGLRKALGDDRPVLFVPTMGALHKGHMSLVKAAVAGEGHVVVSIFVNPLQFGPYEDLAAYPRDERADLRLLEEHGVDTVFVPDMEEMYPPNTTTTVDAGPLGLVLEGEHRPGHFQGVCTVCAKLFNIVDPQRVFFGQKDAQQVAVIKRMVADLNWDVEVVVCPTVRDADGLALSSRNVYLSPLQRRHALALYSSLKEGLAVLEAGGNPFDAQAAIKKSLDSAVGVHADYAVVCDPDTFEAPEIGNEILLAVAGRVGPARLIDNVLWRPKEQEE
jgi:pantoate--beta-alanine ligase